jgi:uncharacterized membrane protein YoaK (UPF0700 family)
LFGGNPIRPSPQNRSHRTTALFSTPGNANLTDVATAIEAENASFLPLFTGATTTTSFFEFPLPTETLVKDTASSSDRLDRIHVNFAVASMAVAGFVEGFSLKAYGSFPNMMTGNCVKLVESLATGGDFKRIIYFTTMILLYIAGGSIFAQWQDYVLTATPKNENATIQSKLLQGVGVMACLTFVLSDLMAGGSMATRLPLLALAFGILHSFVISEMGVVPFAMTGHMTKIGMGLTEQFMFKKDSDGFASSKGYHTSLKGLMAFMGSAWLANVLYGSCAGRIPLPISKLIPSFGTTLAALYGGLFWWLDTATRRAQRDQRKRPLP